MAERGQGTPSAMFLDHFWHPVGFSPSVTARPRVTTLLGESVVLWRTSGGAPRASIDRCPHRGTALSRGSVDGEGRLVCPYHGWAFDESGACVEIPQLSPTTPIPRHIGLPLLACEERSGIVWVCRAAPVADIPRFPEWDDPGYRHVACAPYRWETSPERMIENFTDFGHLGYLHDGLLGTRDELEVPPHRVSVRGFELHYEISMTVPNTNDRFSVTDLDGARGLQTNRYVLTLPYAIHLACRYEASGSYRTLFFAVQPHGDGSCTGYCYQSRNFDLDGEDAPYDRFQSLLAEQDRPIVESQQPVDVPLAPTGELHLPFDRVAVAYRRAMVTLRDQVGHLRAAPEGEGATHESVEVSW